MTSRGYVCLHRLVLMTELKAGVIFDLLILNFGVLGSVSVSHYVAWHTCVAVKSEFQFFLTV